MSRASTSVFPSVTVEGGILAAATLDVIAMRNAGEQSESDYGIRQGLSIRDEISLAFRVAQAHVLRFESQADPGASATTRFVQGVLEEVFGFDDLEPAEHPVALAAGDGRVPVVVVPPADSLDRASDTLSIDRRRSAAFALQDHLNEREGALWGLAANGTTVRLMRDNASLTRPAWLEADLSQMVQTEDIASFALLWLTIHRSRFGQAGAPATDCALERWRDAGTREGEAARDRLAEQVEEALRTLGSGFLSANPDMRDRLTCGELPLTDWFNELLRLVYRLIFLMVAEDRQLLHTVDATAEARELYDRGYALSHLRELAIRRAAWDRHHDRYEGVKVVFGALVDGEPELGLPALGGLFASDQLPHLETAKLPNRALLDAIYRLGWLREKDALVPVNWRAMETEELGSVYESLLELQPQLTDDGRTLVFAQDSAETRGNQRKTTGSYYTPDSLVQALLDTALNPVLDRTEAEAEDPATALLELTVVDPACGSGHFLLAAARRIATRVARHRAAGTPSAADFRHALRDVAGNCLHGVDRNPMAVELTRVALWIETVDPGLPLGFFDAQIRCGDALLGVFDRQVLHDGIPDAAYRPLIGDDKDAAKYYLEANRDAKAGQGRLGIGKERGDLPAARPYTRAAEELRLMPEESVRQVNEKRNRFYQLRRTDAFRRTEEACDIYIAAFLLPKREIPGNQSDRAVPTSEDVWEALRAHPSSADRQFASRARDAHALHWPLEFADIMARGGFDVVLGNPPWEQVTLEEKEFFAARDPEIANAPNKSARVRMIDDLACSQPGTQRRNLYNDYLRAKRFAEAFSAFVGVKDKDGGRYPLTGSGRSNTFALFSELAYSLKGSLGFVGFVLPSGILTDYRLSSFIQNVFDHNAIRNAYTFSNARNYFPDTTTEMFTLMTLGPPDGPPKIVSFIENIQQVNDSARITQISAQSIRLINENTLSVPLFRTREEAVLAEKLTAASGSFCGERPGGSGNRWGASFPGIFNMATDSGHFVESATKRDELERLSFQNLILSDSEHNTYLPLYEGKMVSFYDHRFGSFRGLSRRPGKGGRIENPGPEMKVNPSFEVDAWYIIPERLVIESLARHGWNREWQIVWRFGSKPSNERTLICTTLPRCATPHVLPCIFPDYERVGKKACGLVANLSALPVDFVCRMKMSRQGIDAFILKQLPILPPEFYTGTRLEFVVRRVLELTYTSHSLAPFAQDLGYEGQPFQWDEGRRDELRAELDAFYSRAYGLSRDELRYILDPKEVKGEGYPSETFRVLKNNEVRKYGEYRTARLVLDAWDRFMEDGTFADLDFEP